MLLVLAAFSGTVCNTPHAAAPAAGVGLDRSGLRCGAASGPCSVKDAARGQPPPSGALYASLLRAGTGGGALALRGGFDTGKMGGNDDEDMSEGLDPWESHDEDGDAPEGYASAADVGEDIAGGDGSSGAAMDSDALGVSEADEPSSVDLPADARDAQQRGRTESASGRNRTQKVVNLDPSSDEEGEERKWLQQVDALVDLDDARGVEDAIAQMERAEQTEEAKEQAYEAKISPLPRHREQAARERAETTWLRVLARAKLRGAAEPRGRVYNTPAEKADECIAPCTGVLRERVGSGVGGGASTDEQGPEEQEEGGREKERERSRRVRGWCRLYGFCRRESQPLLPSSRGGEGLWHRH